IDRGTVVSGTTVTGCALSDEEIAGLLTAEANKWLAAARACDVIMSQSLGLSSKSVDGESVSFAQGGSTTYAMHAAKLREKGARVMLDGNGTRTNHTMWNL